ncbi:MAG TPA: methyltransferase domain-containing protein [Pseudonocardiaceae bacterium]|jgi:SAM-dependent methyltransferase|nr:methyltransferase domain-containing protein [Pseudonocardiaceae bacterium]
MDLVTVAVPHTLAELTPLLPPPPARLLEAGCGRGALAAALADLGYAVTGVDRDADMAAAARNRGVSVIEADVLDVSGEYDVVLFTRSLHHAENLDRVLDHAATLLAPDGRLIIEEFAWERVDRAGAHFLYDNRALLVATGLLDADSPAGDLLAAWVEGHDHLHRGSAMLDALRRVGTELTTVGSSMLWRLVDGRGGAWVEPGPHTPGALNAMRDAEERGIAAGLLPAVGLYASVRR